MMKIMMTAPGICLAANQIGVLKQIVTIHIQDNEKKSEKLYVMYNPVIKNYKKEKVIM